MTSEVPETKTVVKRVLKTSEDAKSNLSQSDWTGIISMTLLVGYFVLIGAKYLLDKEITELEGLGAAVGLIVGWYLRGKV